MEGQRVRSEFYIIVATALAAVGWVCFITGFALEGTNPDRLSELGWDHGIEKFSWHAFSVVAALALILQLAFTLSKRQGILHVAIVLAGIGLFFAGGPADATGHFLWDCQRRNDVTNERRTGPGCQEATFDNYALMFAGAITYAVAQTAILSLSLLLIDNQPRFGRLSNGVEWKP